MFDIRNSLIFAILFILCYAFTITDFPVFFSMDIQQSQKLIDTLIPLIGHWEYAEDILVNIRNNSISDTDAEELATILIDASNKAKGDEEFIRMTVAYEKSNLWKNKEQIENQNTKKDIDSTLSLLNTM